MGMRPDATDVAGERRAWVVSTVLVLIAGCVILGCLAFASAEVAHSHDVERQFEPSRVECVTPATTGADTSTCAVYYKDDEGATVMRHAYDLGYEAVREADVDEPCEDVTLEGTTLVVPPSLVRHRADASDG